MKHLNKLLIFVAFFGFSSSAENIYIMGFGHKSSVFSTPVESEEWCHAGSMRDGEVYSFCGIGQSMDESGARMRALNAGLDQFDRICKMSADCANQPHTVEPGRTSCATNGSAWKCWTKIEITLLHER